MRSSFQPPATDRWPQSAHAIDNRSHGQVVQDSRIKRNQAVSPTASGVRASRGSIQRTPQPTSRKMDTPDATNEGYEVQVVADASGSGTKVGDDIALDRMRQAGVSVGSTIQVLSEMVFNWAESPGPEILEILGGLYAAMAE